MKLINKLSGTVSKLAFRLKKHSPEILIAAGVIGTVASAVLACKATTKLSGILEKSKADIDQIHDSIKDEKLADEYSQEDGKKDLTLVYVKTGISLIKLYAPAVALGILSLTSIIASNQILKKRNIAVAAAYATVDKGFKEYRKRVAERFGTEVEHELKYNIKAKQFEETVIDDSTGKEKKVKNTVNVAKISSYSDYARFFDEGSQYWEKDSGYNQAFLRAQQQYANDLLISKGHLFLNEVYDMLGIPRSKAGQAVGWIYNPKNPAGDNYVDFGIYDCNRESHRNFADGYERAIILDFNVDGNIWDKFEDLEG